MFFSLQHLIGQDAKFALVWRAATSGSTKKLPRKAIYGMSVSNMCREILKFTPSGKYTEAELTSKFSLYLLGQLVYGTVVVFDRQVTLLEVDVRSAYEGCRRLPMEELMTNRDLTGRKRHRRSRMIIDMNAGDIDISEPPEGRFVGLARRSDITMLEAEPVIWQRQDLFHDEELQAPIDFSKERFIDWNDQRSSQSSKESIKAISDHLKGSALEPTLLIEELPPFPQPEVFQNMDRISFLEGSHVVHGAGDLGQRDFDRTEVTAPTQPPTENESVAKRLRLEEPSNNQMGVKPIQEKPASSAADNETLQKLSLELSPIHDVAQLRVTPLRRRRNPQPLDVEGLCISYESMKEMQSDYSSLVKSEEELRAGMSHDKHLTLHELLLPFPAYAGNRFPKECVELYRSRFSDNLTYEQAIREDLFDPIYRGPASQLWHYSGSEQSSKEGSEYEILPGIAYLKETPDRIRAAAARQGGASLSADDERLRRSEEVASALLTPGKATIMETPNRRREISATERGQGDIPRRDYANHSTSAIHAETLPLSVDVTLSEYERFRESRNSVLEQARRMTRGTDEMEGRPSSVQLHDPMQTGDISQLSMISASGRLLSLSSSLRERITSEECRLIIDAAREANRPIPLSILIPHTATSKKRAAAIFSALLYLAGKTVVEARQYDPYGEIWVRACSATTSSDHDLDTKLSGRSLMS